MKRGNLARANEIDGDITRIDELVALQCSKKISIELRIVQRGDTPDDVKYIDDGIADAQWKKDMEDTVQLDLAEYFFNRLAVLRAELMRELDRL